MKIHYILLFIIYLSVSSCDKDDIQIHRDVLAFHNMEVIPQKPTSADDIRLIIYDDCTYNILSTKMRTGQSIVIEKQFNSMMYWPCVQQNDTILIGKLPNGIYNVNYTLIDISQTYPENIVLSFNFKMTVSGK